MSQPAQPPEIPAMMQYVPSEDRLDLAVSSSSGSQLPTHPTSVIGLIATPTPPETLSPEWGGSQLISNHHPQTGDNLSLASGEQTHRGDGEQSTPSPQSSDAEFAEKLSPEKHQLIPSHPISVTLQLSNINRLIAQERGGEVREFEFTIPTADTPSFPSQGIPPLPNEHQRQPIPDSAVTPESETTQETPPASTTGVLELTADQQQYDQNQRVITAQGNVLFRFRGAVLNANRVQVNLPNRILVAEGDVTLTRGNQVLRGERFEYSFVQDSGVVAQARGEIYIPTSGTDLSILPSPADPNAPEEQRRNSSRITSNQPLLGVSNVGFYTFVLGGSIAAQRSISNVNLPQAGGTINRFRYEADQVDFQGSEAIATNVRITNDPFSPPELELRAQTARLRRIAPLVDEVVASRPRLVFDQGISVPTFRNRIIIDRREREPALLRFGFDDDDRGGLFVERPFEIINTPTIQFSVTPQYLIQRAIFGENNPNTANKDDSGGLLDPASFGLKARLDATLTPRTTLVARATFTSLDPDEFEEELRASLRLQQVIGTTLPHRLNLEYSYRDRLFNGSLGFQTVQSSLGAVLTSPVIFLGDTGIDLTYQAGIQNITADTDRLDLLEPIRDNNRINLTRYQGSTSLGRNFILWQGQPLSATPTEGLRYTSTPVVPYLQLLTRVTGVTSAYSNGDTQESLSGTIGLVGQLGHFSKPYLDYTGFNISYTQVARGNLSPFTFDRVVDTSVLSAGITQQVYGPFRVGFQTAWNLDTGEEISTDLFVEYSRRTYNIFLRYNPVQQLGSISLRINDFNWTGNPGLFDCSENRPVVQGVNQCIGSGE